MLICGTMRQSIGNVGFFRLFEDIPGGPPERRHITIQGN